MQQILRFFSLLLINNLPLFHRIILRFFVVLMLMTITSFRLNNTNFYLKNELTIKKIKFKKRKIPCIMKDKNKFNNNFLYIKENFFLNKKLKEKQFNIKKIFYKQDSSILVILKTDSNLNNIQDTCNSKVNNINQYSNKKYKILCNIQINKNLFWNFKKKNMKNKLQQLTKNPMKKIYQLKSLNQNNIINDLFNINNSFQERDWIDRVMKGTISVSFDSSARDAGLTSKEITEIINAMDWQMDFRKLKKGDQFSVLISQEIFEKKNEQGQIIAVHLRSNGKDYYAIRAEDGKFYNLNGISFVKNFLRSPTIKQFPISSNFSLHRLNPITGKMSPHLGVDYAIPQGTPILAVGDGEVIFAGYSNEAGFYITVQHGRTYMTRYMHLYKILVKQGQKVKRGDRIALSGNTGRSTGPHLHYEVWVNQQAVNPLTAKFPPYIKELTGKNRLDYLEQIKEVVPKLQFD